MRSGAVSRTQRQGEGCESYRAKKAEPAAVRGEKSPRDNPFRPDTPDTVALAGMAPTTAKLKLDIDWGRGGVDANDPAAAPLGPDEEAAGTPPPPDAIAQAHKHEIADTPVSSERKDGERRESAPAFRENLTVTVHWWWPRVGRC
jgi:hypothetical protein